MTETLEGQLAFLQHVHVYEENRRGTHILQPRLLWKYEFLCCFRGCLSSSEMEGLTQEIFEISKIRHDFSSWSVRSSKALSGALRHGISLKLGRYMDATLEDLHTLTRLRPFDWHPRKFFSFLMANSKGGFSWWVAPKALVFDRFFDWDFDISVGAIQGLSRMPGEVAEEALAERLTAERCRQLGMIFHASHNSNYESIRERGLILTAVRFGGQRHRRAIHFVYAAGEVSPGAGTVIKYGNYMFYAKLDYESFLNHGHELYLTSNGVVHYRPPHEKDPGGLRYEKKQHEAGVGFSREEGTSASASASATGGSPQGEVPNGASEPKVKEMPKRPRTSDQAADSSTPKGGSPQGEVPTLDKESLQKSLQKLIRENELEEEKKRQAAAAESEGSTRYAYQQGDTVHGKVDATKAQQQEELNEILRRARTNPWRLFKSGLLRRIDDAGMRNLKKLLGDEFTWASWLQHATAFRIRPALLPQGIRARQAHWELPCRVPSKAKGLRQWLSFAI